MSAEFNTIEALAGSGAASTANASGNGDGKKVYITAIEAAELAGVTKQRITKLVKDNVLETVRRGRFYRVEKGSVINFVNNRAAEIERVRQRRQAEPKLEDFDPAGENVRICSKCLKPKPLTDAYWHRDNQKYMRGYHTVCAACRSRQRASASRVSQHSEAGEEGGLSSSPAGAGSGLIAVGHFLALRTREVLPAEADRILAILNNAGESDNSIIQVLRQKASLGKLRLVVVVNIADNSLAEGLYTGGARAEMIAIQLKLETWWLQLHRVS